MQHKLRDEAQKGLNHLGLLLRCKEGGGGVRQKKKGYRWQGGGIERVVLAESKVTTVVVETGKLVFDEFGCDFARKRGIVDSKNGGCAG